VTVNISFDFTYFKMLICYIKGNIYCRTYRWTNCILWLQKQLTLLVCS